MESLGPSVRDMRWIDAFRQLSVMQLSDYVFTFTERKVSPLLLPISFEILLTVDNLRDDLRRSDDATY